MEVFRNRPLALSGAFFALISFVSFAYGRSVTILILALAASAFLAFLRPLLSRKRVLYPVLLCLVMSVSACLFSALYFDARYGGLQRLRGRECRVEGVVLERTHSLPYESQLRVRVQTVDGERTHCTALVGFSFATHLQTGDAFCLTALAEEFPDIGDGRGERSALSDGNLLYLNCTDSDLCQKTGESRDPLILVKRASTVLSHRLAGLVGGRAGGLSASLLLGDRARLMPDDSLAFRRSGVSHLLAISGMHVAIVLGALDRFLRLVRVPKRIRAFFSIASALGYMALTGFSASAVRAVLMSCVLAFSFFAKEEYDSVTALFCALTLILIVTPYAVGDVALWLSFFASGSIILFSSFTRPRFADGKRGGLGRRAFGAFFSALAVGLSANLMVLFVTAKVFGEISLFSVPATIVLSLPVTALLILSLLTLVIPPLGIVCAGIGNGILTLCDAFSSVDYAMISVDDAVSRGLFLLTFALMAVLAVGKIRNRIFLLLPTVSALLAVTAAVLITVLPTAGVTVHYAERYGGEVLVLTERGHAAAFDFSDGSAGSAYDIVLAAKQGRATMIDELTVCRYYRRAPAFLSSLTGMIRIKTLYLPKPLNEAEVAMYLRMREEAELHGVRVAERGTGETILSGISLDCNLHTAYDAKRSSRIFLSLRSGNDVLTYLNGAIAEESNDPRVAHGIRNATVLILGKRAGGEGVLAASYDRLRLLICADPADRKRVMHIERGTRILLRPVNARFFFQKPLSVVSESGFFSYPFTVGARNQG